MRNYPVFNNIPKDLFMELIRSEQPESISIYLPTSRIGNNEAARIRLKNRFGHIKNQLTERNMKKVQIRNYLEPIEQMIAEEELWSHQEEGLAIFLNKNIFRYYSLPLPLTEFSDVADHFYLLPIFPFFTGNITYLVLMISLKNVRLFEATRDQISEINISELKPQTIEESVGYDYEQKYTQVRTGQTSTGQAIYHGHGEGKDDKKTEIEKYLRDIDKGLAGILKGKNLPLLIVGVEYVASLYKKLSHCSKIVDEVVEGNFMDDDLNTLHFRTWEKISQHCSYPERQYLENFELMKSKNKATSLITDIVAASENGNIECLLVNNDVLDFSNIDAWRNTILPSSITAEKIHHLADRIAKKVFIHDGSVFMVENDKMPEKEIIMSAILRY